MNLTGKWDGMRGEGRRIEPSSLRCVGLGEAARCGSAGGARSSPGIQGQHLREAASP